MTDYEVSLDRIKKNVEIQDDWTEEDRKHYETIKIALERNIPKNPFLFKCPTCNGDNISVWQDGGFTDTKFDFCPDCGQALDWEDTQ